MEIKDLKNVGTKFKPLTGTLAGCLLRFEGVRKYVGTTEWRCTMEAGDPVAISNPDLPIEIVQEAAPQADDDGVPAEFAAWCQHMDAVEQMDQYRAAIAEKILAIIRQAERSMPGVEFDLSVQYDTHHSAYGPNRHASSVTVFARVSRS